MLESWTDKTAPEKLREILEKWPLYREVQYSGATKTSTPPEIISLYCDKCGKEQGWDTSIYPGDYRVGSRWQKYTCRNCREREVVFYFYWTYKDGKGLFLKVGQYPRQEDVPSPEVRKVLTEQDAEYFKKASWSRNFNMGAAALVYLRRVVESQMNRLLDLLADAAREAEYGAKELERLEEMKRSNEFDEKVAYAALILPPHLRPGRTNPVDLLHELTVNRKSDIECIEVFERCKLVFEYLFRELQAHKEGAKAYVQALQTLNSTKSKSL